MNKKSILKIISKVLSWVVLAFLGIVAIFFVYYIVSSKIYEIKGEKYEPTFSLYTIISPSMEPNIRVYDVVFTKKVTNPDEIKEGDVITFISTSSLGEGLTITHRVKEVVRTDSSVKFRTQGDNNSTPDAALTSSDKIIGKVLFKIPQLGRLQFLLQSKGGWLFVLLIPAVMVVIYDIIKVLRLSSVKQKVNESLKQMEEDPEKKEKQNELKQSLKKKFVNVSSVSPIVSMNDDKKEEIIPDEEIIQDEVIEDKNNEDVHEEITDNVIEGFMVPEEEVPIEENKVEEVVEKVETIEDVSNSNEFKNKTDNYKKKKKKKHHHHNNYTNYKNSTPKKVEKIENVKNNSDILANKDKLIKNANNVSRESGEHDKIMEKLKTLNDDSDLLPKIKKK